MAAAAHLAVEHLAQKVGKQPIHIVGYSTGAPLALDFTLNALDGRTGPVPASLVLISPAIGIHAAAAAASWKRRLAVLPGLGNLAWLNVEPEFDPYKYNSFTTNAGDQVHRVTRSVSRRIASRARSPQAGALPPILVFKSNADSTVSTDAVVTRLLGLLDPNRHELVLFEVNREAAKSMLLVYDRRALTNRVMGDNRLPFAVTLVTSENEESATVVARHQAPFSAEVSQTESLNMAWPAGTISLSHLRLRRGTRAGVDRQRRWASQRASGIVSARRAGRQPDSLNRSRLDDQVEHEVLRRCAACGPGLLEALDPHHVLLAFDRRVALDAPRQRAPLARRSAGDALLVEVTIAHHQARACRRGRRLTGLRRHFEERARAGSAEPGFRRRRAAECQGAAVGRGQSQLWRTGFALDCNLQGARQELGECGIGVRQRRWAGHHRRHPLAELKLRGVEQLIADAKAIAAAGHAEPAVAELDSQRFVR
jgi:alpha-beta hydrolase superfamily lysophospholipase